MRPDGDVHIRAGMLRHYVTINQLQPSSPPVYDEAQQLSSWLPFASRVPAQIGPDRSTDALRQGQIITQTTTPISIRYLPGILPNMQVVAPNGSTYVVQGVINIDERNIILELECVLLGNQT